jgi:putative acetyltransferase
VIIRPESAADIESIHAVTEMAFSGAAHTSHTEHLIVDALRSAGALHISLVAEASGVLIGHVAISPVTVSDGSPDWYGLGPVSVLPANQAQGIGSSLVRSALGLLRERGAAGCVVLGNPAFYSRFGFKADTGLVLPGVPREYFRTISFAERAPRGIVEYHAAFNVKC